MQFISSVRGRPRAVSEKTMRKANAKKARKGRAGIDEVLPEYDFRRSRPNKYASRYAKGSIVVTLDPDVAAVFPGVREANDALRALAGVIRNQKSRRSARRSA
jgi:hypothetical protein